MQRGEPYGYILFLLFFPRLNVRPLATDYACIVQNIITVHIYYKDSKNSVMTDVVALLFQSCTFFVFLSSGNMVH